VVLDLALAPRAIPMRDSLVLAIDAHEVIEIRQRRPPPLHDLTIPDLGRASAAGDGGGGDNIRHPWLWRWTTAAIDTPDPLVAAIVGVANAVEVTGDLDQVCFRDRAGDVRCIARLRPGALPGRAGRRRRGQGRRRDRRAPWRRLRTVDLRQGRVLEAPRSPRAVTRASTARSRSPPTTTDSALSRPTAACCAGAGSRRAWCSRPAA